MTVVEARRSRRDKRYDAKPTDPDEVRDLIEYLRNRQQFSNDFANYLQDDPRRNPALAQAFRSPDLALRSMHTCYNLILTLEERIQAESNRARKDKMYRLKEVAMQERHLLDAIVRGDEARSGRASLRPSPRGRAIQRLIRENLARFQQLQDEEFEKIAAEEQRKTGPRRSPGRKSRRR